MAPASVHGTQHSVRALSAARQASRAGRPAAEGDGWSAASFGRWRLTRRLPSGGRLSVFRAAAAADRGPGCYVVKASASGDALAAAMLRREAVVAAEVSCPHLASVVASELRAARPHHVMPYLEGITLRRLIRWQAERAGLAPISVSFALSIGRQIAAALTAMQVASWLHCQVRPEHVIVSPRGHATLIDLSQARRLDSPECMLDGSGSRSPIYAAPEMFAAKRELTAAADIYSLGVVLFEVLTGQPPFSGVALPQLASRHRFERPPDLRRHRPDASNEAGEIVRRMLAKEPLRRPTAEQVVRWLAEMEIEELACNPSLALRACVDPSLTRRVSV